MRALGPLWLLGTCAWALPLPLHAQIGVVIYGRVEDAVSREPLAGALIFSADSSAAVLADSLGAFAIPMGSGPPFVVHAEQLGYLPDIFELPEAAPSQLSILVLQPAPLTVEGLTVVGESELTALAERLEGRRDSYPGAVRALDQEQILSAAAGSARELVMRRVFRLRDCETGTSPSLATVYYCRPSRGATLTRGPPSEELLVCIDGVRSRTPGLDLEAVSTVDVALAEFYGPLAFGTAMGALLTSTVGQVRIYTRPYITRTAGSRRALLPVFLGC